ncbi:MAG: hypothetical protein D6696_11185 [Acidobacteria bacterium]|nr:MAG: hypothetical protein D6696_11185 [Acidobacteriota bacterium]
MSKGGEGHGGDRRHDRGEQLRRKRLRRSRGDGEQHLKRRWLHEHEERARNKYRHRLDDEWDEDEAAAAGEPAAATGEPGADAEQGD